MQALFQHYSLIADCQQNNDDILNKEIFRLNDDETYYIGARPEAGNIGFFIAVPLTHLNELQDQEDGEEIGIPIINMKYYWTDQFVLKAGVQVWKKRRVLERLMEMSFLWSDSIFLHFFVGFHRIF